MMHTLGRIRHVLLSLVLLSPCGVAWADWDLDNTGSVINFVSIKNNSVAEVHSLPSLVGFISADGNAQVTINLDSVQTLIDIRNERMREMLFETVKFPVATITATVDPAVLAMVSEGDVVTTEQSVTLSLHGQEKTFTAPLLIIGEGENRLRVLSTAPVLINAADFGLADGVDALQKVAGLQAISSAVPVTLQLQFVKVP